MCSPQGGKKQTCGHVASLQGHSQAASKDRHTELFKCPCPGCLVHVCVCGYSYKIVKHPPSPPISSHMNKYMHKDFGEVTCLWQLHLSVWGRIVLESHKVNDTKYPPPLSFSSPRFSFSICHKLFSPTPLWPRSPSCLPLTPQPSSLNSVVLFSFPSPDILPGSIAETSDLSRGTHGQHPCLLFSLFFLSSLPSSVHLSPVNTSYSLFCFFSSITCSPTNLAFLPMVFTSPPPFAPLRSSSLSLPRFYAWPFACIFLSCCLSFFNFPLIAIHNPSLSPSFFPRLPPHSRSLHPSSLPQIKVGIGGLGLGWGPVL